MSVIPGRRSTPTETSGQTVFVNCT